MANFSVIVNGDTSRLKKQIQTIAKTETVTVKVNAKGDSLKTVSKQVTTLDGQTKKITTSTERFGKSQQLLGTTTKTVTKDLQMAGVASDSLAGKFGTIIKKVATFGLATAVIGLFTTGVYEAGRAIKEFDSAVTDFKKVSDLSGDALDSYTKKLGEMGKETARTRTEMVEASTEFKKSGYTEADSAILAKTATLFQNIADSELSAGDASSIIISQLKAFNLTAEESTRVIDVINEVSNRYAVSSTDLSQGLSKTATAMSTMGNTLEESVGLMVGAGEQMPHQSGKIARGLRSIALELNKYAQENKYLKTSLGDISLYDKQTGALKSTFNVLSDLYKIYPKLSKEEQTQIGLKLAGKNQYEVFSATMNGFKNVLSATTTALNSEGSATKENSKYMESLSAKINLAKSEFQELVLGDGGLSDLIKMLVDAGTAILKFANSDMGGVLIKAIALIAGFKLLTKGIGLLKVGLLGVAKVLGIVTASATVAQITLGTLLTALAPFLIGGAVLLGIYAIYKSVTDTEGRLKSAQETLEKTNGTVKELQGEYDALKDRGGDLNDAEKNRLKYLEEELELLREQKKEQEQIVAQRSIEDYTYKTKENKTVKKGDEEFTHKVTIKVEGQAGLDMAISKFDELKKSYEKGTITQSDYIKQQQKLVSGTDELWKHYETLINSGAELDSSSIANAEALARMNVELVDAGGKSNVLSDTLRGYANTVANSAKPVTEQFANSLVYEGNQYKFVSESAKKSAITIVDTEINKTKNLLEQAKARVDMYRQEAEARDALNSVPIANIIGKGLSAGAKVAVAPFEKQVKQYEGLLNRLNANKKEINQISVSVPGSVGGGDSGGGGGKGSKSGGSGTDKYKERAEKEITTLKHNYEMGKISTKKYYDSLDKLNSKYYKGKKKYLDDYRKYEEQVHEYESQQAKEVLESRLSRLDTEYGYTEKNRKRFVDSLKKYRKANKISVDEMNDYYNQYYNLRAKNYIEDYGNNKKTYGQVKNLLYTYVKEGKIKWSEYYQYIDDLNDTFLETQRNNIEKQKETLNLQLEALDWYAEQQQNALDEQIKALEKEKELLNEQNDERERAIELERLEEALAQAKSKRIKLYKEGEGFVYAQDTEAISQAQEDLNEYKVEEEKRLDEERIDNQIDALQEQKDAWSKYVSDYKNLQNKLLNEQQLGMTYEKLIQDKKITNLQSFATEYKKIIDELIEAQKQLIALQEEQKALEEQQKAEQDRVSGAVDKWNDKVADKAEKAKYTAKDKYGGIHYAQSKDKLNQIIADANKKGYAGGSKTLPFSQWVNYDEQGDELIIPPEVNTGKVGYMSKGTGIVPHTLSENLMEIGKYSMNGLKSVLSGNKTSGVTTINTGNWVFPSITNGSDAQQLFDEIKQFKNLAIQNSYKRV